ncbi:hypothetical protein TRSC58_01064 [Trypanosoma rangeli SC58]|uniref:Uncharacterized protein n=1 Tax=Trypanosoma rangeli SC58 TaxID=429131 RepID=A0A061J6Y0_TRYRA|nr:hypothetical protein TRSC58_01064 [Trypanosoma rangeli SC58]
MLLLFFFRGFVLFCLTTGGLFIIVLHLQRGAWYFSVMPLTPNDDIVEISRRCDFLRMALANADDAFKTDPTLKYMYLCEVSGERPNPTFLCFSKGTYGSRLDLHRDYLSQRAILPIILTLPFVSMAQAHQSSRGASHHHPHRNLV